jgi:hypothetical protein
MIYGSLNQSEKELKKAILILDNKELSLLIVACEEYAANHKREKKIKDLIKGLDDIAVF